MTDQTQTQTQTQTQAQVLVVGAGPVGLTVAVELARRGVGVRIVDQLAEPTTQSRAILVHSRSLEALERIGVVQNVIDAGVRTDAMELRSDRGELTRVEFGGVDSPYPFSVTIAQTETERILTAALARHGVSVERGLTLTGLEQDDAGVRARLRRADGGDGGGEEMVVSAALVVGADGAHSTVRHQVGSALAGSFKGERFLMGDVHADHDFDPHTMYMYFSAHGGPLLVFPMRGDGLAGDRMRLIAQVATDAEGPATLEWLQAVTDDRAPGHIKIRDARWLTTFDIHHAQVPQYRVGRVLLAGDAAHVHSPAGGQGMNTGIQDAFNLGWKLARAVSDGSSNSAALLDSYHEERHPVGARVIAFTTALTHAATLANPLLEKVRNTAVHAATALAPVRHAMADKIEETALSYRGGPLTVPGAAAGPTSGDHLPDVPRLPSLRAALAAESGHLLLTVDPGGNAAAPAVAEVTHVLVAPDDAPRPGYAAVLADPDGHAAARLGLPTGGRVLIRPDGYVAATAPLDDDAPLHAYLALLDR